MGNVDDISIELPAPRDDEPENLRTDIVAELADHLECAFQREIHSQASGGRQPTDSAPETAARDRILTRFGNPSAIARQLWWGAMQERIMNQRLIIAVLVVLVLMSGGMFVISWQSLGANREMVRESHELNRELIAELRHLAAASAAPSAPVQPAEWNRLIVRCVLDSEDGPPAERVRVLLDGQSENAKEIPQVVEFTDTDGEIDFGLVLYGVYELRVTATTGEQHERSVSIRPGMDRMETIVCPSQPPAEATVSFEVSLPDSVPVPDELRDRLWLSCILHKAGRDIANGHWQPGVQSQFPSFLLRASDGMVIVLDGDWPDAVDETTTNTISCEAGEYRLVDARFVGEELPESGDQISWTRGGQVRSIGRSTLRASDLQFTAKTDETNQWTIEIGPEGFAEQLAELGLSD